MIRIQITDGTAHEDEALWLARLNPGVDFIQVRERGVPARELARLVRIAMKVAPVIVNDRADVAIACGAAGVHLRAGSVRQREIRGLAELIVTVSCHNEEELRAAEGADYALVAPVFSPLSKEDARTPLGLTELARLCTMAPVPVVALGGVTESNSRECIAAGAAGVAGITSLRRPL